ncbi:MAG: DUF4331 family protein [Candidatus Limnocylindria bacterium]
MALAALALVVGSAALRVGAADHLDAPSLGTLALGALKGDRDINDVYAFGVAGNRTVLAMTTHPAVNLSINPFKTYGTTVRYTINVDRNGDAVQDLAYVATFGAADVNGDQAYTITRYTGANAVSQAVGNERAMGSTAGSGTTSLKGDGMAFAGERSDPFFFDLIGFRGTLGLDTATTERLCSLAEDPEPDETGEDFFSALNTMAIVIEVADDQLGGQIGVWADTRQWTGSSWALVDQMGRPAINTVFNSGAAKESFNVTPPSMQDDAGQPYRGNVSGVLQALGGYDVPTADFLASLLIPDVITYDTASADTNILNGRDLNDDVIDAELGIVTQGNPALDSDCVGPHGDYLPSFPYLGIPH